MLFRRFLLLISAALLTIGTTAVGQQKAASADASPAAAKPEAHAEDAAAGLASPGDSQPAREKEQATEAAPKDAAFSHADKSPAAVTDSGATDENQLQGSITSSPPNENDGRVTVQLLLVRTDWSQGKDVADLDGTLKEVLKDIALPEPLRANLATAAPAALFPSQFPVTYEPGEFAAALAWMRAHELVRVEEIELLPVHEDYLTDTDGYQRFFVGDKLMPVPDDGRGSVPPYVTQEKGWEWCLHFTSHDREEPDENAKRLIDLDIQRRAQKRDQRSVRGQAAVSSVDTTYESIPIRVTFPAEQVLAMSGYTPDTVEQSDWWNLLASQQEWQPIVTLSPASLRASEVAEPRLTSPTSIVEVSRPQNFRFPARLDQGFKRDDTSSVEIADDNTGRVTVQLIRVRSDWSKGKDPEETRKALESLLEGASLPDEFRKDLLGSASRILFPEDFAAIYQPGQFADLLAWMTERDLVHIDARSEPLPDDSESRADPECRLFVSHDVVPLPINPRSKPAPPFVTRTYGWEWTCTSWLESDDRGGQPNLQIDLLRAGLQLDEFQVDGEKSVTREPLSGDVKSVALPADRIAVIRHFDSRDAMSQRTREAGWEPFLVVRPVALGEPQASDHPQPSRPSALVKLSNRSLKRATPVVQRESDSDSGKQSLKADDSDKRVTVFALKHASATELVPLLQALIPSGALTADQQANSLVAHGAENELNNLKALLEKLDVPTASPRQQTIPPTPIDGQQIKIFSLKNTEAQQMNEILRQCLRDVIPDVVLVPDLRTNSLITHGREDQLRILESLLMKLDETPSKPPAPPSGEASRRENLDATRNEFASKESEVRSVAQSIAAKKDAAAAKELRMRLERLVTEAFDLRQKLQRAEASLLKERIAIIDARLRQREVLRKEIIQQRLEVLLAGDEDWTLPGRNGAAAERPAETGVETPVPVRLDPVPIAHTTTSWVSDDVVRFLNAADREAAWKVAYEQQRLKNPWHSSLSQQFHECIKTIAQDEKLPNDFLIEYQAFATNYVPFLKRIAPSVTWNDAAYASIQRTSYWAARPLSVEVRTAQEDIWAYQAILGSIAEVNEWATTEGRKLPIHRIEALEIGQPAGTAMESTRPRRARLAYFGDVQGLPDRRVDEAAPKTFAPAVTPSETSTPHTRTEEEVAKTLRAGRYVDLSGTPLPAGMQRYPEFNLLPVRLVVDIEESRLPDLLAQLAACSMPVDVGYVELNSGRSAQVGNGSGQHNQQVRAEILGVIRIFNPPDKAKPSGAPEGSALPGPVPSASEQSTGMHFGPRPGLPLRSPEEFHRAARDAGEDIANVKRTLDRVVTRPEGWSESQYKEELVHLEDNLASAEQQLSLIQAEFAAQLQLLALDVRTSEAQLATASEALQRLTKLYQQKVVPESELSDARLKQEQALLQLEQAKTLLDLYEKAGQNPDLNPRSAKPPKDATDNKGASTEAASPAPPLTGGASPGSTSRLHLRSPGEFQLLAASARTKTEKLEKDLAKAPSQKDAMDPALYERYVSDLTAELASARQQLSMIQAEYAAQIQILAADLAAAEAPRAEANKAEHDQAKSKRDRAVTLLKLYENLQTNPDLVPPTKEEPKAGKPAPILPVPGPAADPGTTPAGPQSAGAAPAATP